MKDGWVSNFNELFTLEDLIQIELVNTRSNGHTKNIIFKAFTKKRAKVLFCFNN